MELSERSFGNRYIVVALTSVLVFVCMGVLSLKLDREVVRAEKAQFDLRVAELKAAVLLIEANLVAKDRMIEAVEYIGSNPLSILDTKEMNYAGERNLAYIEDKERRELVGMWLYDTSQQEIVYLPRSTAFLVSLEIPEEKRPSLLASGLQFRVVGLWSDVERQKKIKGLRLETLYK